MKFNTLLFTTLIWSLTSCKGQGVSKSVNNKDSFLTITAEPVTKLGDNIMLVYQDKKDNYWFGSWQNGLYKYDGKVIKHYTTKTGLPNNRIDEIKEDKMGNVYFNTSSGIIKYDGKSFSILKVAEAGGEWKLMPNDLWFKDGWNTGFVYRYDGNSLYKLPLPKTKLGEDHISNNPNNPNPYTVYSIYKDRKGNVWFGTGAVGAFRFDGQSFEWILERDVVEVLNDPSEPSNGVRSIIEDKEGYFWFNSKYRYKIYGSNASSTATTDSIFYSRAESVGSLDGKSDGNLFEYLSIAKDNNNELWIATYNAGVWRYDGKHITHYTVKDGSKEITLFSIYKDNAGNLWLGTHENGVFKFNGKSFERYR